nr:MAG TPA: hypothetical protein [Caudoviricetes sp.]
MNFKRLQIWHRILSQFSKVKNLRDKEVKVWQ